MAIRALADMTAAEVKALDRDRTALFITVSPIEEHGPHLPLATDLLEAEGLGRRMCGRLEDELEDWTFLFYPRIPLGSGCFTYPGTADIRPGVIRHAVEDVARSFARHGFRWFVLLSHHGAPSHNLALDAAARAVSRSTEARVLSLSGRLVVELYLEKGLHDFYRAYGVPETDWDALDVDIHAGAFETSEVLALAPGLVRESWRTLEPVLLPLHKVTPRSLLTAGRGLGYFGAPALASAEMGEAFLGFVVDRLYPDVRRFLAGEAVRGLSPKWRAILRAMGWMADVRAVFSA